jgi:hypothetical protein
MPDGNKSSAANVAGVLDALDEVLLDVAAVIELSPADRRVAENRYRRLKAHLERDSSALKPFLTEGDSFIYAQGSVATSTTIISGTEDDRFDLDAIVEIIVPSDWSAEDPLNILHESLEGFPGVQKIVRCTRCVQLIFPFMHMDVTILDRATAHPIARAGQIFHSPDDGNAYRVDSNPWGFTDWYRGQLNKHQEAFQKLLLEHRASAGRSRLPVLDEDERIVVAKADQLDLPPVIPTRFDAQESVALKLLKRFLNLEYEDSPLKRPPSIYLAKRTGLYGFEPAGLTAQLYGLARSIATEMRTHIAAGTRPSESNPTYPKDKINDRWPREGAEGVTDMKALATSLDKLTRRLEQMRTAPLQDITKYIDELFGEKVGADQRRILKERYQRGKEDPSLMLKQGSGQVYAPAIVRPREEVREIPRHNFHSGFIKKGGKN